MSEPIGIGVIGLGESGQLHMSIIQGDRVRQAAQPAAAPLNFIGASRRFVRHVLGRDRPDTPRPFDPGVESFKIAAVSDVDEGRLTAVKQQFDIPYATTEYKKLLARKDIEAVLICTPPVFHPEITLDAARHGKHIFCEKPMAMTSARCMEMLEATEKAGVVFQVGYMLRFATERGQIADAIRNEKIGRPVFFRESMSLRAGGDQRWIHDQELGGGPLWEVSHMIDFVRYLFGNPETVYGIGGRYKPDQTSAIDTYAASLVFPSGDRALIGDSFALKGFGWDKEKIACRRHRTEIDIVGPRGYMQFPDADLSHKLTICTYAEPENRIEKFPWTSEWAEWGADGYKKQFIHFAECIRQNKTPAVSGSEGLQTVQLAEAILSSIHTGEARRFGTLP
jgi:predicted dehydrogenase